MITPKVQFEKQFGQGVDPWHEKAKRWAKKQKFPISFLALGLIAVSYTQLTLPPILRV